MPVERIDTCLFSLYSSFSGNVFGILRRFTSPDKGVRVFPETFECFWGNTYLFFNSFERMAKTKVLEKFVILNH